MSRIGKLPIKIPPLTETLFNDNTSILEITGKYGKLQIKIPQVLTINEKKNVLLVNLKSITRNNRALQGLYRTLINNMYIGVSNQFSKTLNLQGVGYRALVKGKSLILNLGFSHPVEIPIPDYISIEVIQNTTINIKSSDKQLLGMFADKVRSWRPPEPYKGKGILYKDEQILRKAGKSGKK